MLFLCASSAFRTSGKERGEKEERKRRGKKGKVETSGKEGQG
jgi:hypothetical protein